MKVPDAIRTALPWTGAALTGLLLSAALPPLEWRDTAWIAFLPLFLALRRAPDKALKLGFTAGAVFWLVSIWWITHVSVAGWIGLSLYCALYFMPFAWLAAWWMRRMGVRAWWSNVLLMVAAAAAWVGLEYVRSVLFTGFPWVPLGVTQYRNGALIQAARWGGVYAVSALVVWVNAAIALTVLRYVNLRGRWERHPHPELMFGFLALVLAFTNGWNTLRKDTVPTQELRVAVVQPNIPQEDKWTKETFGMTYQRLRTLTETALRAGDADLVIWPETAVPDYIRDSEDSYGLVRDMATGGKPLLVGSMDISWEDEEPLFYNSSFLFDTNAVIVRVYDKRHLVPFGEYVPLQPFVPFIQALTPIEGSFTPGRTSTVFRLESRDAAFSVLICFEDTVASLARASVRNGARLLVNQTNDAWFDPSSASRQHMIQCVFRCVENGVPAVRCANTGVSCFIDRSGRVYDVLDDGEGRTRVSGCRTSALRVPEQDLPLTFYTRHGDVFAWACLFIAGVPFGIALRRTTASR